MATTLEIFNKFAKFSSGKWLFSKLICWKAPYFNTIKPLFVELKPGYCEIKIKKRRAVENHLHGVHAIAMANLCELAAGMMTEVSIPNHLRWIPTHMEIAYLHKAKTNVKGIAKFELPHWQDSQDIKVPVSVLDENNVEVVHADITMRVSQKK